MRRPTPWPSPSPPPALALALLLLVAPAVAGCRTAAVAGAATPLTEVGERLERSLAAGERHTFTLDLEAGRFVHLVIAERGADVVATLSGPGGELLAAADGPGEGRGQELLAAVTGEAGRHQVEVELRPGAVAGAYQLRYLGLREAEATDGELILGMRAYLEGKQLEIRDAEPERRERALAAYEEAAGRFEKAGDVNYLAWSLVQAANLHLLAERWVEAEERARRADELFASLGAEAENGRANALTALAPALVGQGRFAAASGVFDELFAMDLSLKVRALDLNNRGDLHLRTGNLPEAKADFESALKLWSLVADLEAKSQVVATLINLGVAHRQAGELLEAYRRYEEAAALAERHGNLRNRAHLATNLGRYYIAAGELQLALETLTSGLTAARRLGNVEMEVAITGSLGLLYQLLGQPEEAYFYLRQGLTLARRSGDPTATMNALLLLGRWNRNQGDLPLARERLEQALRLSDDVPSPLARSNALTELAELEVLAHDERKALGLIERAKQLSDGSSTLQLATVSYAEALALRGLGREQEALAALEQVLDPTVVVDDPLLLSAIHALSGDLSRRRGDLDTALDHLEKAVELYELLRSRVVDPRQRASFVASGYDHFQALIDLLMEMHGLHPDQGFAVRAFQVSERLRARSLVELLSEARVDVRRHISDELRRRDDEISLRIALLQSELLFAARGETDDADSTRLRRSLARARREQQRLSAEVRKSWSDYASLRYPEPLELSAIQRLLAQDEVLLHYTLAPERSFLFAISNSGFSAFPLPAADRIAGAVRRMLDTLVADDPRSLARLARQSRDLHDLLVAPARELAAPARRYWIVPDGALYRLPFEALRSGDELLVRSKVISYLPSANVMGLPPSGRSESPGTTFVAFAGVVGDAIAPAGDVRRDLVAQLPGTVAEVEAIARLVPDGFKLYLGPEAHQGNLFDNAVVSRARWLHFASHAFILADGAESAILLSPDPHGDRLLQISEVFNLDLSAEVVVLSACETALGETLRGDGMIGLTRAFFYAGSPNLVVSLWPVDDRATATLMELFYRQLTRELAPSAALRQAKLDLIQETPYRSPRFWAPFVVMEAPRSAAVTGADMGPPVTSSAIRSIDTKEGER